MKISIFTPAHKPTWLHDVWASLKRQTFTDFEWVVLANGLGRESVGHKIDEICGEDRRVRLINASDSEGQGIGALKREACGSCKGDVLVELDYDDTLVADALEMIASVADTTPPNTFIYSDAITCMFDRKQPSNKESGAYIFGTDWGWQHYEATVEGKSFIVNKTFPPTPRSLCEILYAPDHVRCWKREAYHLAGGHDASMNGGDDHELIVRTYLAGARFERIPHPLYFHRFEAENESSIRVQHNLTQSMATRDKYLHPLVMEWCRRNNLPMFDLGGAHNCPALFTPIDENLPANVSGLCKDVLDALTEMHDNSVGCIRAYDFMEHVKPNLIVHLLNLIYDKLVPGGYLLTSTPAVCDDDGRCGVGAFRDPDHKSFWHAQNWLYYTDRDLAKYLHDYKARFQAIRRFVGYSSDWHKQNLLPYVWCDLAALKDGNSYWPGPVRI